MGSCLKDEDPNSFDFGRLAFAGPRRHRHPNDGKWLTTRVSKLEGSSDGNGEGDARPQVDGLIEAIHAPAPICPSPWVMYRSAVTVRWR